MAKCKALTGSVVKGLNHTITNLLSIIYLYEVLCNFVNALVLIFFVILYCWLCVRKVSWPVESSTAAVLENLL